MRYSEFHLSSKARQDAGQSKMTSPAELSSFMAEDKFVELLWDNGQVVLHDQSDKSRRATTNFSADVLRPYVDSVNERDNKDVGASKIERLGAVDSFLNEVCLPDSSYNVEPNAQDDADDMVPWLNYPMDDSIPHEYYSEFLCDVPDANFHPMSAHVTSVPLNTNNAASELFRSSHNIEHGNTSKICSDGSDPLRIRTSYFTELPQQGQASVLAGTKTKAEGFSTVGNNNGNKGSSRSFDGGKSQKQDLPTGKPPQPSTVGLMNFSHFTRPAALAMASLRNVGKLRNQENPTIPSNATKSKTLEPVAFQCSTKANLQSGSQRQLDPIPTKLFRESSVKTSKDVTHFEHNKANCQEHKTSNATRKNSDGENCISIDHNSRWGSNFTAGLPVTMAETEKGREAIVASSSICSGIDAGQVSNEPRQRDKRKVQEAEESSSHSDDFEDELVDQTKSATVSKGPSTKRSRAAEVHNLSERRRRDRINEKMRALQELIPNCSKVDKASMLDEAIEYLKTLQLQLQMMSMGGGLCVPPMMLPGGMQHMGIPPITHFPQIGLGMGMGMRLGYGMGMLDMNGSPNYTLLPLPPMHSPQYHCPAPSVPGVIGLHGAPMHMPASMAPMFRVPGQGLPVSATNAPTGNPASDLPPPANSSEAETNRAHALDTRPSSTCADQLGKIAKLETVENCGTDGSQRTGRILQKVSEHLGNACSETRTMN